jgi:ribonuclease E
VAEADAGSGDAAASPAVTDDADDQAAGRRPRRRRNTRTRTRASDAAADDDLDGQGGSEGADAEADAEGDGEPGDDGGSEGTAGRRRRRKRRRGSADGDALSPDDPPDTVVHVREAHNPADDVRAIRGSTRLEAKKQRRREGRESGRRRPPVVTESEFLARRESVERTMVVRQRGDRTQIAVLEDGVLVEHYVNRTTHASYVGNVYLGKVQNVLPSMEAAFVDIGKGRNAVLYAGEVNFDASGLEGQPKRIEAALKPGQSVIVQVTKDPVGHKGARLTSQVSLPGRYLVYVPGASMTGISRKLPDTERTRLKQILKKVTPENAGVIVRTAAEGAAEAELDRDITRLAAQWESIEKKAKTASAPALLHGEPDLTVRVVRDVFNEDFSRLIVSGDEGWEIIDEYVKYVAPHLADRISRWDHDEDPADDVFAAYRIDEQLAKALDRKVWLPSGGSLVIDRTEAMTVVDVNTGKFTGQGGNLEETVTRNNLEAAEEIVRQLRLRDVGGIVVIDFIDMVLESNRELVLRRLLECLARDRTKHQVAEVTSLGLVQMTRKRVGAGLLEAFSQQCECCNGRGVIVSLDAPAEPAHRASAGTAHRPVPAPPAHGPANGNGKSQGNGSGAGSSSGSGAAKGGGYANGRRDSDRRDSGRRDEGRGRDAQREAATATTVDDTELAGAGLTSSGLTGTGLTDTALSSATGASPAGASATGTEGGRRTRRPTSAGTAFAAAVQVEDSPAPAVVVPVTPEPALADQATVGATAPADDATDAAAPPVRRTRAGSAVARVTVVTDTTPAPAPAPVEDTAPASAEDATPAPAEDLAPALVEDAVAPATSEAAAIAPEQAESPVPTQTPESFVAPEPAETAESQTLEPAETPEATAEAALVVPLAEAAAPAWTGGAEAFAADAPADAASAAEAAPAEASPAGIDEAAAEPVAAAAPEPVTAWPTGPAIVSPSLFEATPGDSAVTPAESDATPAETGSAPASDAEADSAQDGTASPDDTTAEGDEPPV